MPVVMKRVYALAAVVLGALMMLGFLLWLIFSAIGWPFIIALAAIALMAGGSAYLLSDR